jgi:hypothetical protein
MQFGKRGLGTNSVLFEYVSRPVQSLLCNRPSIVSFQLTQVETRLLVSGQLLLLQISRYFSTMTDARSPFSQVLWPAYFQH